MPRERFKSAIYKSIIICDDPKGVAECGSIRKLKNTAQQREHKSDVVKPAKNSNKSLTHKSNKTEAGEMVSEQVVDVNHCPPTSQLLEIAKGAQRLNHMIEPWSKGLSDSSRPNYIGKDLLKGALDLQESLNVLARLQEASQYMVKSNNRRNSFERGSSEEMAIERTDSNRYRDKTCSLEFQRPRLSPDDSPQRCADDIKDLIRNSLSRQNLLENESSKQYYFHQRNVESISEIPSTSSSQSSTAHTDIFSSIDSSSSSVVPQNMIDGPNLIARLMGLEEMASKKSETSLQKQWESERVFNRQMPAVDIDMPRIRKSHIAAVKIDPEMRTLRQTHEKIHSKGILKDSSSKRLNPHSHRPSNPCSKEKLSSEGSPIVLLKPHVSGTESGGSLVTSLGDRETFGTRNALKKHIVRGKPADEGANLKDQTLPTRKIENPNASETPSNLGGKVDLKETLTKRHSPEERTLDFESLPRKPVAREVKAAEKAPSKMKASGRIIHNSQDTFVNEKIVIKIQKVTVTGKKTSEKNILKSKHVSGPQHRPKSSVIKQRESEDGSKIRNNQTSLHRNRTLKSVSNNVMAPHDSFDQKKDQRKCNKPIKQSTAVLSTPDNLRDRNHDKKTVCTPGSHIVPTSSSGRVGHEIPTKGIESTELGSEEHGSEDREVNSTRGGGLLEIVGNDRDSNSSEAAEILVTPIVEYDRKTKLGSCLKSLLLSTPSFLSHVDKYFDAHMNCPSMSRADSNKYCDIGSDRLVIDYANELVKHKTLPDAYIAYPLSLSRVYSSNLSINIDQLLQEVCNGIEFFRSFCKLLGEDLHVDGVCAMLKKDMMSKDVVDGIWDLGWRNGFSVSDAEEVVSNVEDLVLSELIEEIFL